MIAIRHLALALLLLVPAGLALWLIPTCAVWLIDAIIMRHPADQPIPLLWQKLDPVLGRIQQGFEELQQAQKGSDIVARLRDTAPADIPVPPITFPPVDHPPELRRFLEDYLVPQ